MSVDAIQFYAPHQARSIELPEPAAPGEGEVLVRTHRMGICGTDYSSFLGKFPYFEYPRIPGHELGLEVLEVGKGVLHLKPGDRCALEPYVNNPESRTSELGKSNCCPDVKVLGVHTDGGLRERWVCPARKLHVGGDLSYDTLALVETLAIGRHAVQRANPVPGEIVLVIGAGPIGLACLAYLASLELEVVIMDMSAERLKFCSSQYELLDTIQVSAEDDGLAKLEALTRGNLADVVIDATGSARSMSTCFRFAAYGGRVVYVGITAQELTFPHAPVFHRRELTLLASRNALSADFRRIIDLISSGRINVDPWITHRIPFADAADCFEQLARPDSGVIKAMIELSSFV